MSQLGHGNVLGFYSECSGKLLEGVMQRHVIRITFYSYVQKGYGVLGILCYGPGGYHDDLGGGQKRMKKLYF